MKTFLSPKHRLHHPMMELNRGRLGESYDRPNRIETIAVALAAAGFDPPASPPEASMETILRVHDSSYVEFLQCAHGDWIALGRQGEALPMAWPVRGMRVDIVPSSLDGRIGYYAFDVGTPITAGTWAAAKGSADAAIAAADVLGHGNSAAFALCRPPGHHAARDYFGGYCYLNNAAIAAQRLLDSGAERVAVLDVDYHHGNGTQEIFYRRSDVLYVSIHADPITDYPYFSGHTDEIGTGPGGGFNLNMPLPRGTDWNRWSEALRTAAHRIAAHHPDALVVSLGVDTFVGDPLAGFKLQSADYLRLGASIAELSPRVLFVMEGGYAVDELGANVVNVLHGFAEG